MSTHNCNGTEASVSLDPIKEFSNSFDASINVGIFKVLGCINLGKTYFLLSVSTGTSESVFRDFSEVRSSMRDSSNTNFQLAESSHWQLSSSSRAGGRGAAENAMNKSTRRRSVSSPLVVMCIASTFFLSPSPNSMEGEEEGKKEESKRGRRRGRRDEERVPCMSLCERSEGRPLLQPHSSK